VYKHISADVWIYHCSGLWRVGPMCGTSKVYAYAEDNESSNPAAVASRWHVNHAVNHAQGAWIENDALVISAELFDAFKFNVGNQVEIVGLINNVDLNGTTGVLKQYYHKKGRWLVARQSSQQYIRPRNLRLLSNRGTRSTIYPCINRHPYGHTYPNWKRSNIIW
jgi:hypothetical protein